MTHQEHKSGTPSPLASVRASLRLGAAALGTLPLVVALGVSRLVTRGALRRRARRRLMMAWGRLSLWAFGARLSVEGPLPEAPAITVSNHVSYLDILAHAATSGAVFVSMAELRDWPVIGRMATLGGTIYVDRNRKRELVSVNSAVERALENGEHVVFFPEGTSSPGAGVLEFRPALLESAVRSGRAVHVAALSYRTHAPDPPAGTCVPWQGPAPFIAHAWRLAGVRGVDVHLRYAREAHRGADRKALARTLHDEVEKLFTPLDAASGHSG